MSSSSYQFINLISDAISIYLYIHKDTISPYIVTHTYVLVFAKKKNKTIFSTETLISIRHVRITPRILYFKIA